MSVATNLIIQSLSIIPFSPSPLLALKMNSTTFPSGIPHADTPTTFNYRIGLSVGIFLLTISAITFLSYYCARSYSSRPRPSRTHVNSAYSPTPSSVDLAAGIDEATLSSYPKLLYSNAKLQNKDSTSSSCCSICLADYSDAETLRMLPECGHLFHVKCVDAWLRLHPTCPVCRTSPLPTPLSTPLSDLVPLASRV